MFARVAAVGGVAAIVVGLAAAPASADAGVTSLSVSSGTVGTVVHVLGSGFSNATGVTFNGVAGTAFALIGDGEVDATVPATATSGAVDVVMSDSSVVAGPTFTVLPTLSLIGSTGSVFYPSTVRLTATLSSGGAGLAGQSVTLQTRPAASQTWGNGPTATTGSNGAATFTMRPVANTVYRAAFTPTASYGAATSNSVSVHEHPSITFPLPTTMPILTSIKVKGSVRPVQTGQVALQRYYSGAWHTVGHGTLSTYGNYTVTIKLPAKGTFSYRVRRYSDPTQAGNTTAAKKVLGVDRTLRSGLSGADVTALQKRLAALHYDVGRITGGYNFDTFHAVVAFEKIQGMTRDGVVGTSVWKALIAPRVPHLRHPISGVAAIEVDLTHQVLYYAVNAKIVRIFDSSTGGGYYYQGSDGSWQRAITPTGHFSVKYKVDHWVKSKLGVLYRPAYFNYAGYAIHGEPEVPSYPASHGCVRITVPAMDRLYSKLYVGLSVWIYHT